MILVDTSVWIAHLRSSNQELVDLLEDERVLTHSFVIGELSCGSLRNRAEFLRNIRSLPKPQVAIDDDVHFTIEHYHLSGRGIGWIDAHLIAACLLGSVGLWSGDVRLVAAASSAGVRVFQPK